VTGCDCKQLGLLGVVPEERIAKPLYGLTPVPRVRIPPSPPVLTISRGLVVRNPTPDSPTVSGLHRRTLVPFENEYHKCVKGRREQGHAIEGTAGLFKATARFVSSLRDL
jgi:hypothetical protein